MKKIFSSIIKKTKIFFYLTHTYLDMKKTLLNLKLKTNYQTIHSPNLSLEKLDYRQKVLEREVFKYEK